jgi:hypothetical protein
VRRLLVTASVVPSAPILVTLIKEALSSCETPVFTRAARRDIKEDAIFHRHLLVLGIKRHRIEIAESESESESLCD